VSEKTPLALLPGLLLDGTFWHHQVAALADIAEPWVADFTSQDSIAAMAQSVLAAMPERFALCGLSMGGYVAQEIMRQAPERVERLALLDTKARPDDADTTARRRGLIELAQKGAFKGVTPRLLPLLIHPDRLEDEEGSPVEPGTQMYTTEGIVEAYSEDMIASGLVTEKHRKILLLAKPLETEPKAGDEIQIEGQAFTVTGVPERDPATATWTVRGEL